VAIQTATVSIQPSTSVTFVGTISLDYYVNPAQDFFNTTTSPGLKWVMSPSKAVTASFKSSVSIQAQSISYAESATSGFIGSGIRQSSVVKATPTLIRASEDIDKNVGSGQAAIALSQITRGEAVAKIVGLRWSNFKGLQTGFRIVSGTYPYESVAVFLEDPQFKSDTVRVNITVPFETDFLEPAKWRFDSPEGTDFNQDVNTPNYFRESDILSTLMKDMRKFVVQDSQYLTSRTSDLRKWDRIDPDFLGPLGQTMGMSIRMDRFDDEARRRAVHEWIQFCEYAGTEAFMGFGGYVLDTIFTLDHLWTNDYRNFVPYEFVDNSSYYPTNHVSLRYDANLFDINNSDDLRYVYDLFYKLASVPLVLEAVYSFNLDKTNIWIQGIDYEQEYAPVELNDFPPNFWIVAVETDIDYIFDEPNELPPNFWIVPVDQDIEYVFSYIEEIDPTIVNVYWEDDPALTDPDIDIINQGLTITLDPNA
jgi:hypothetical protein